jgi:hypothetical protein
MKSFLSLLVTGLVLAASTALAQFTPNRVVVLQTVDNSTGGAGTLVEYNRAGATTYQVVLPADSTTNSATSIVFGNLSGGGNQTLNHDITLSADGALIIVGGFANNFASVDASTGTQSPRVVATVKYNGVYARPFKSTTALSGATIRGTTSDGFGNFWGHGSTAATYLNGPTAVGTGACRTIDIVNGNICYTKAPGTSFGVYQVNGMPTTGGSAETLIIASSAMGSGSTPGGFAIPANPVVGSIAYLTDYNGSPNRGIGHYHWDGSTWVWDYNLLLAGTKPQHIAVDYSGPNPFVYVTPTGAVGNRLYAFDDTNSTAVQLTLATAPAGTVFRGVAITPTQPAAPAFTVQPVNTTNNYGGTAVFGPVSATAANPNAYTWLKGSVTLTDGPTGTGSVISGSTTETLTISGISGSDATTYYAVASNNGGSVTSTPAILALAGSSITTQLVSITNVAGTTASFHVVSGGPAPLTYAWQFGTTPVGDGPSPSGSGAVISGSSTDTLTITGVQDVDAGSYTVTVTDNSSAQSLSSATLTVVDPPGINTEPANQNKVVGATANFSVAATGGSLSYQWFKGATPLNNGATGLGSTISGAKSATLSIASVQSGDAGSYSVTVTNLAGSTNSTQATLTVGVLPSIAGLTSSTNVLGSDAVFSATVTAGTGPFTYTWRHNGTVMTDDGFHIFGSTTTSLGITNVDVTDHRLYALSVSNSYGGVTVSANLNVIIDTNHPNDVANLIIYDPFNYPEGPATAVGFYSWENVISIYNRVTGQPAFWSNTGGGLNSGVAAQDPATLYSSAARNGGLYPWPGIDCSAVNKWGFAGGGNNNHLKFGGVTNGAAYFSFIFTGDQGSAVNNGTFDTIAGFTSGISDGLGLNRDTWNYKLCTMADSSPGENNPPNVDGPGGFRLGVFKGNGSAISAASVNGQWASPHLLRGHPYFIVGCYKINSGGTSASDDVLSLWITPLSSTFGASEANVPAPDAGGTITNWNSNAAITEFAIRASGGSPFSKSISDLRIGKTWASVTNPYYPILKMANSPSDVTLSWPAKDSFGGFGYQLNTSTDAAGPYALDGNSPSPNGTTNVVTETPPSGNQFWLLYYPPRSGAFAVY